MARIIVTGSSRGIGFELVQLFAAEGHEVMALSRNETPVKNLKNKNINAFPFDIGQVSDMEKVVEKIRSEWGTVNFLIHNAGSLINKPFLETTNTDFEEVYRVNVFGVAALNKAVLPFMGKEGHILAISSMGGVQGSAKFPGLSAYSSSKAALISLTEVLAEEFKESGPSFNVLALGAVQTEMLEEAFPGYRAPLSAFEMAKFIHDFTLTGHKYFNGKCIPVSKSTP